MSALLSGSLSATGNTNPALVTHSHFGGHVVHFNVSVDGTFVGTILLQRTYDDPGNITFDGNGNPTFNGPWHTVATYTAPQEAVLDEPEAGVWYRFNVTAYTSGTINYRIGQTK